MTSSMLNLDLTPEELDGNYGEHEYYWYLKSPEFRFSFLRPLGALVSSFGCDCLDVGCGEGWLADYVTVPYVGFDGSRKAIETAKSVHRGQIFTITRLEKPRFIRKTFSTVVFGGILGVLIKPERYVEFLELYQHTFNPTWFFLYDLENLNTSAIDERYDLVGWLRRSVSMAGIPEVKKHRKILVYQCN